LVRAALRARTPVVNATGEQQPGWESVQKLADALGVSTQAFRSVGG
jgi:hypothetical protein